MLQVEHIAKTFGERQVLEDVNLQVNQGDVVVILGPSGSGKTTFLRCLNHLEKADSGRLTLAGKTYDLAKLSKKDILEIRQKTAFVFQHYNLFANKTALKNILEGLIVARKVPKEEALKRAESALEKVGLLAYKDYYPSQLSGGQQQRIGIARAIAVKPEVILLDEPTRGIDVGAKHEIYNVIYALAAQGVAVLFASSDLPEVLGVADRIVVMREGEIAGELLHEQADERQALSLAMPKVSQAVA